MEVGLRIKAYIEEKGIKQKFISEKTGIEPAKLNLALNGHRRLTFFEYEMICWALDVGVDKFLQPRIPEDFRKREG